MVVFLWSNCGSAHSLSSFNQSRACLPCLGLPLPVFNGGDAA
uniref:Uncharacterized protein n=1 Tax=Arundo donax TaxID=35708 RepID=A0A0A9CCW2_ARUDO